MAKKSHVTGWITRGPTHLDNHAESDYTRQGDPTSMLCFLFFYDNKPRGARFLVDGAEFWIRSPALNIAANANAEAYLYNEPEETCVGQRFTCCAPAPSLANTLPTRMACVQNGGPPDDCLDENGKHTGRRLSAAACAERAKSRRDNIYRYETELQQAVQKRAREIVKYVLDARHGRLGYKQLTMSESLAYHIFTSCFTII